MTNTSISLYLRLIISAIVLNLSFVKSAPVLVNSNSNNEIEEDAEYVPSGNCEIRLPLKLISIHFAFKY